MIVVYTYVPNYSRTLYAPVMHLFSFPLDRFHGGSPFARHSSILKEGCACASAWDGGAENDVRVAAASLVPAPLRRRVHVAAPRLAPNHPQ